MAAVYEPRFVRQLDGSVYQGLNCVAASDAMWVDRATTGQTRTTGAHVRTLTADTFGGLTLDQVRYVDRVYFRLNGDQENKIAWNQLPIRSQHSGFILLGGYRAFANTRYDCFRGGFVGNHGVYVNSYNPTSKTWRVGDPGADGRYNGCPLGFQNIPDSVLRKFASLYITGFTGPPIGDGWAQVLFTPPDSIGVHYSVSLVAQKYWVYHVTRGVIISRRVANTGGFSGTCSRPVRYPWPALHTTRVLVEITSGSHAGQYIHATYAKET